MGSTIWTNSLESAVKQGLATEAAVTRSLRREPHIRRARARAPALAPAPAPPVDLLWATGGLRNQFVAGRFDADVWTELGAKDINSTRHQQIQKEAALQVPSQLILCSAASCSWHRA